jgi:hypothetical protein
MTYRKDTQTVLYCSKMNPNLKRNFALFPVLDWIAEITAHIPAKREQLVRYYGAYSNGSRGKSKKERVKEQPTEVTEVSPPPISRALERRWSHFIRKAYETDPLVCPKCSGEMRIISFIDRRDVIRKILEHLGLWEEAHAPPVRGPPEKEITFDPSFSQLMEEPSPSFGPKQRAALFGS